MSETKVTRTSSGRINGLSYKNTISVTKSFQTCIKLCLRSFNKEKIRSRIEVKVVGPSKPRLNIILRHDWYVDCFGWEIYEHVIVDTDNSVSTKLSTKHRNGYLWIKKFARNHVIEYYETSFFLQNTFLRKEYFFSGIAKKYNFDNRGKRYIKPRKIRLPL